MRKALLFAVPFMVVLGVSCVKESDGTAVKETTTPSSDEVLTVIARPGDAPDTKTAIQSNGTSIYWTPGDAINLFYGSGSAGQFTTAITEAVEVAEFTGTLSVATGSTEAGHEAKAFWAIYPYNAANTCDGTGVTLTIPGEQETIPGSFADKLNPTVATSPGLDLAFYNVGSWFIFSVTQEGVTSATFRGNNNEDIAGTVRVSMDASSRPVATVQSGIKSITITPASGGSFAVGEEYYIVVLPQTLENGYTLTLRKDNRHVAECVISSSATFTRSMYRRKRNADNGLTYSMPKPEMVDLGLPSGNKWASFNVGATAPEEYGDYFAWGETEPKTDYSWGTYKYGSSVVNITKYCTNSTFGIVDCLTELLSIDDAAWAAYGSFWYTPTEEDYTELLNECTWTRSPGGFMVTGQNGNSIFLPAAGWMSGTSLNSDGIDGAGMYATSTLAIPWSDQCEGLCFSSDPSLKNNNSRAWGLSIRPVYKDRSKDYLTFHILTDGVISFNADVDEDACTIYYSKDRGNTWTRLSASDVSQTNSFSVSTGDVVSFKGNRAWYGNQNNDFYYFGSTCRFVVSGNIMSLINGSSFETLNSFSKTYVFRRLFNDCTKLVDASRLVLPATTLSQGCYEFMFDGCTSLTIAPKLHATSLKPYCYSHMFRGCTSLTIAPNLPATTLENGCYENMFEGCSSLENAPTLAATTLAGSCYSYMFRGCTSLTTAPDLPATTLAGACYFYMFNGCTSLTIAPNLPATTLENVCYDHMFDGCTSLRYIKCLATDMPASGSSATTGWVKNVSSTGTFYKKRTMTGWTRGDNGIPSGWTVYNANSLLSGEILP